MYWTFVLSTVSANFKFLQELCLFCSLLFVLVFWDSQKVLLFCNLHFGSFGQKLCLRFQIFTYPKHLFILQKIFVLNFWCKTKNWAALLQVFPNILCPEVFCCPSLFVFLSLTFKKIWHHLCLNLHLFSCPISFVFLLNL